MDILPFLTVLLTNCYPMVSQVNDAGSFAPTKAVLICWAITKWSHGHGSPQAWNIETNRAKSKDRIPSVEMLCSLEVSN